MRPQSRGTRTMLDALQPQIPARPAQAKDSPLRMVRHPDNRLGRRRTKDGRGPLHIMPQAPAHPRTPRRTQIAQHDTGNSPQGVREANGRRAPPPQQATQAPMVRGDLHRMRTPLCVAALRENMQPRLRRNQVPRGPVGSETPTPRTRAPRIRGTSQPPRNLSARQLEMLAVPRAVRPKCRPTIGPRALPRPHHSTSQRWHPRAGQRANRPQAVQCPPKQPPHPHRPHRREGGRTVLGGTPWRPEPGTPAPTQHAARPARPGSPGAPTTPAPTSRRAAHGSNADTTQGTTAYAAT